MLKHFHDRVRAASDREDGMTLVEVLVAMFIFSVISIGFIYGMLAVLSITRDSRATQVATNLASQEIDLARATEDLFALGQTTARPDVTVNGDIFHISVVADWQSDIASGLQCGTTSAGGAGAPLRYKRVDVTVTWDGMKSASSAVHAYTIINPKERINDPALGTILISVTTDAGIGVQGATVTATPASTPNGATSLTTAPAATDAQGCTYILKVKPGNYVVTVSKANYLSSGTSGVQLATPTVNPVVVVAGKATSQSFIYDNASNFALTYASNSTDTTVRIPENMDTSFLHVRGLSVSAATTNSRTRTIARFPFASGAYNIMAGKYVAPTAGDGAVAATAGCVAVNPAEWPKVTEGAVTYGPPVATVPGAVPGVTQSVGVPMGVFKITTALTGRYLKAVSVDGSPRCASTMTYTFGQLSTSSTTNTLALPYGSWLLYTGISAATQATPVLGATLTPVTKGTSNATSNVLLLDPRVVVTP